jgi:hypothetical protein
MHNRGIPVSTPQILMLSGPAVANFLHRWITCQRMSGLPSVDQNQLVGLEIGGNPLVDASNKLGQTISTSIDRNNDRELHAKRL